jgi:hypothetical protein
MIFTFRPHLIAPTQTNVANPAFLTLPANKPLLPPVII